MLRYAAAGAIALYQRRLSPHKGFSCAYRVHTGGCSCSEFARRFVLRAGLLRLLAILPRRFRKCRSAHLALAEKAESERKKGQWTDPFPKEWACLAADCGGQCCLLGLFF